MENKKMENKKMETPKIEVVRFSSEDILTTSGYIDNDNDNDVSWP